MSQSTRSGLSHGHNTEAQANTIGSIPMRPMPISINITKDVEAHGDATMDYGSDGVYERKRKTESDEDIATVQ